VYLAAEAPPPQPGQKMFHSYFFSKNITAFAPALPLWLLCTIFLYTFYEPVPRATQTSVNLSFLTIINTNRHKVTTKIRTNFRGH
jgi:hypothetical protein